MRSKTIAASGADYTTIQGWLASIADTDNETGTCTGSTDLAGGAQCVFNQSNTGSWTYLLTADSSNQVNAPTKAACDSKARALCTGQGVSGTFAISGKGWTIEKLGVISGETFIGWPVYLTGSDPVILRRLVTYTNNTSADSSQFVLNGSGTYTLDNIACWAPNGHGLRSGATSSCTAYQCTAYVYNGHGAISDASTNPFPVYGCYAQIDTADQNGDFNSGGAGWGSANYNASHDNTAPGSTNVRGISGLLTSVGSTTWDFSITSATTVNIVDRTTPTFPSDTDTDIVGTSRPSTGADAGVWQTPSGGGSAIKTWDGLADASTKTANGLARASVKTRNGLA